MARDTSPDRAAFVRRFAPLAREWEQYTGIPASMWLAIAGSESNFGSTGNSLFGVKGSGTAGSQNMATWEGPDKQHRTDTNADFANYNNYEEAFQGMWNFLNSNPRYQKALTYLNGPNANPDQFLREINKAGYAADQTWYQSIEDLQNQLQPVLDTTPDPTLGNPPNPIHANGPGGYAPGTPGGLYYDGNQVGATPNGGDSPLTPEEMAQAVSGSMPPGSDPTYIDPTDPTSFYDTPAGSILPGGYGIDDWGKLVADHKGIASSGASKMKQVPDPADPLGRQKIWAPDPNAPTLVAFGDGTVVQARFSGKPDHPDGPVQVFPWNTKKTGAPTVRQWNDGSLKQYVPETDTWKQIAPPPDLTDKKTPKIVTTDTGDVLQYNWDTRQWDTIYKGDKTPNVQRWDDGSLHVYDGATGVWKQIAPPDPMKQQKAQIDLATAQRALMPEQQRLFQDAQDSIDMLHKKMSSGEMSYTEGNQLINEIHKGLQASLAGTTLFDMQKQDQLVQQQKASEASTLLQRRIADTTNLAQSLLATAAGHVLMPVGKTTLGIDPYAIAKAETDDLAGGPGLYTQAQNILKNFFNVANPASSGGGDVGSAQPADAAAGNIGRGQTQGNANHFQDPSAASASPSPSLYPFGMGAMGANPSGFSGIVPSSLEGPSSNEAAGQGSTPSPQMNQYGMGPMGQSPLHGIYPGGFGSADQKTPSMQPTIPLSSLEGPSVLDRLAQMLLGAAR